MPRKLNMQVGNVFGDLKVLRIWRLPEASSKTQCDAECLRCGSVKSYYASNLIAGKTTSCGCKAVGKITKTCVICGKPFDSYRSDNRVTCSDACRRLRAAKSSHDKPRKWGEDAKRRRAENPDIKARMDELQPRALQAALAKPEGSAGRKTGEARSGCWSIRVEIECHAPICSTGRATIIGSLSRKLRKRSETMLRTVSRGDFKRSRHACEAIHRARDLCITIRIGGCCLCLSRQRIGANRMIQINSVYSLPCAGSFLT